MARRQRASWGCVQRMAQGKYRLRWMEDGKRRTETLYGTRREADDRMAEIRTRVGSGPSKRQVTVAEVYEGYYWPEVLETTVGGTQDSVASLWRAHVSKRWGGMPLAEVRPLDVQEWLLTLTKSQAEKSLRILRAVFRKAAVYGLVDTTPMEIRYRLPHRVDARRSTDVIRGCDVETYYRAAESAGLGAMFVLAACCGLRVGESLGPKVGEVERDYADGVAVAAVPVLRQVDDKGHVLFKSVGGEQVERLKTRKSERWAAVGGEWAERLLALQDEAAARGDVWLTDDGTGAPVSQWVAREAWGRALEAAGLPHILLKNLRASFATQMEARDVPVEQVARLMGHTKPTITFDTYQRPDKSRSVQIAAHAVRTN